MCNNTLLQCEFKLDNFQLEVLSKLDLLQKKLVDRQKKSSLSFQNLLSNISRMIKNDTQIKFPIQGLYMWGDVGCGKTWMMDLFFKSLIIKRKLRLHFHRFMLRLHKELISLQGQDNPILIIADRFYDETDIICFDELSISNITDAMLLGTLIKALFERGISLVVTSNLSPDNLYLNGLHREYFLPVIQEIKKHCEVININSGIDYRLRKLTLISLWKFPLNNISYFAMCNLFKFFSGTNNQYKTVLNINHRNIVIRGSSNGVLAIEFSILCGAERNQDDYIELSRCFHTILVYNISVMSSSSEDQARRFLSLIDELYDRHVKLAASAEVSFFKIYQGIQLKFEYKRCLSRLQEMQSIEYLQLSHLS